MSALALILAACGEGAGGGGDDGDDVGTPTSLTRPDADASQTGERLVLTSPAFDPGGEIPARFTCDGEAGAPALEWGNLPDRTTSLALTMVDPEAPGDQYVHWIVTDIPGIADGLPEGGPPAGSVTVHENDAGVAAWTGPCPPEGESHTYVFTLYVLNEVPELEGSPDDDVAAIQGASTARVELTATYGR